MDRLHQRLRQYELPDVQTRLSTLIEVISTQTGPDVGWTIHQALRRHLPSESSQITGFRVSVAYSFTNDDMICVMLEWREWTGVEVLAIFDVDPDDPGRYSYIMHYGMDLKMMDEERWGSTSVLWNLSDMSDLRILLEATQHVLGILDLPGRDVEILYGGDRKRNCSTEAYAPLRGDSDFV
jgi:hypothetical protein